MSQRTGQPQRVELSERSLSVGTPQEGWGDSRAFEGVREIRVTGVVIPIVGADSYVTLELWTRENLDLQPGSTPGATYSLHVPLKRNYAGDETAFMTRCRRTLWRGERPRRVGGAKAWRWRWRLPDGTAYGLDPADPFLIELELLQVDAEGRPCP